MAGIPRATARGGHCCPTEHKTKPILSKQSNETHKVLKRVWCSPFGTWQIPRSNTHWQRCQVYLGSICSALHCLVSHVEHPNSFQKQKTKPFSLINNDPLFCTAHPLAETPLPSHNQCWRCQVDLGSICSAVHRLVSHVQHPNSFPKQKTKPFTWINNDPRFCTAHPLAETSPPSHNQCWRCQVYVGSICSALHWLVSHVEHRNSL